MSDICKGVYVIGVDGAMGSAVRRAPTPHLDGLLADGVVTYRGRTVVPSSSYQAWGAMFHGVGPETHLIDGEHPCADDTPWPSFMLVAKRARPELPCASFSCWNPINQHILEPGLECHRVSLPDPELAAAASHYIRTTRPGMLFIHFDFIDGAGHSHSYGSDAYLEQIAATDAEVGRVLGAIRDAGQWDESLIVALSDHGGSGTSHGGDDPGCLEIFWGCRGPGVRQGVELEGVVGIAQTAPTVARALGIVSPKGWEARVPDGVFQA
ncbi:alkaline phosphatase family protein [Candidatus Latescibacterota bacterium]